MKKNFIRFSSKSVVSFERWLVDWHHDNHNNEAKSADSILFALMKILLAVKWRNVNKKKRIERKFVVDSRQCINAAAAIAIDADVVATAHFECDSVDIKKEKKSTDDDIYIRLNVIV